MKVREALENLLLEDRSPTGIRDAKLLAPKMERALRASANAMAEILMATVPHNALKTCVTAGVAAMVEES